MKKVKGSKSFPSSMGYYKIKQAIADFVKESGVTVKNTVHERFDNQEWETVYYYYYQN